MKHKRHPTIKTSNYRLHSAQSRGGRYGFRGPQAKKPAITIANISLILLFQKAHSFKKKEINRSI
jgi:hypothetical protein